jgi:uncharacterized protein YndB with AHSA1/START domain
MTDVPKFILDRVFDAPREMVWRAWTDPELLARWYGPGIETIIHEFDPRPGGRWLNEMKWGDNSFYQKVIFTEVTPPESLVWHHYSSTDADWNNAPNPKMPDWPHLLLTTVTFETRGEKTNVRLSQVPHEATDAEIACFAEMMAGMSKGWGSGYGIMDEIFAELRTSGSA